MEKRSKQKSIKEDKVFKKRNFILIFGVLALIIVLSLFIIFCFSKDENVITIDGITYTEKDFNMYVYLLKYINFGVDHTELTDDDFDTIIDKENETTVREYLKTSAFAKIKTSAATRKMADDNNITLTKKDLDEIDADKQRFIDELGGYRKFKKTLKKNGTDEKTYDEVTETSKLYLKIYDELYAEGKVNDLTSEEKELYTNMYYDNYYKIKQIVFLKRNLETNKYLSGDEIISKQDKAEEVLKLINDDTLNNIDNFDSYIEAYSEGSKTGESEYYLVDELSDEIYNGISTLQEGQVSSVISTQYAFHIIKRETLDDGKLDTYLDDMRDTKLASSLADYLDNLKIVKSDYLEKVTLK